MGKDWFAPPTQYTSNPLGCSRRRPLCCAAAVEGSCCSCPSCRLLLQHLLPPPDGPVCYCCMVTPAGGAPRWCTTLLHQQPALPSCSGSESPVRWMLQRQLTGKIRIQCSLLCYAFCCLSILVDEVLLEFGDVLLEFWWKISGYLNSMTLFLSGLERL